MALLKWLVLVVPAMALCVLALGTFARTESLTEAQLKAALLYNFASFTDWPADLPASAPLVIGVTGNDAIAAALRALPERTTGGRAIQMQSVDESQNPHQCQILFISSANLRSIAATLAQVQNAPVLTVGEHEQFTRLGGIIRLFDDSGHLRFEIDAPHASRVRLKISSRVLNLARIVGNGDADKF
jgi:sugar (pentulose or hexulose) kinase